MPGKHAYKKNCFKMKNKTGLMKIEKKKNGNTSAPFDRHCFKKANEEASPLKTSHNAVWRGLRNLDRKTEEFKENIRSSNIGQRIKKGEDKLRKKITKFLGG